MVSIIALVLMAYGVVVLQWKDGRELITVAHPLPLADAPSCFAFKLRAPNTGAIGLQLGDSVGKVLMQGRGDGSLGHLKSHDILAEQLVLVCDCGEYYLRVVEVSPDPCAPSNS